MLLAAAALLTAVTVSLALAVEASGLRRVRSAEGAVALTFDDGPDPRYTPAVLDALEKADASATFFVVGENAKRNPELIARMIAQGHEVAHHTQTHPRLDRISPSRFASELDRGLHTLAAVGTPRPKWYRPPRGYRDARLEAMAEERGLRVALWARCFEKGSYRSAREMAASMAAATRAGDIVLAHDGLGDRKMTVEALPLYLESMRTRGIEVVSLRDLDRRARDTD